jgi:acetate kinase
MHQDGLRILTVNAGSSSLRLALFEAKGGDVRCLHADHREAAGTGGEPLQAMLGRASGRIDLAVHRIVHGGRLDHAAAIDRATEAEIERCSALAPLHNPPALRWVRACRAALGDVRQVAVFDTAFFAGLPEVARTYALPAELSRAHGLRRFGFHGIAHHALWQAWCGQRPDLRRGGRLITLQLGAGCSIAAIAEGRPIDTSMGFTPLEGLMMATRSGDLDPGIVTYLLRNGGLAAEAVDDLLERHSGLAGVGGAADMRALLADGRPRARLAVEMFCYRARKYVGAYLAALGGADGVVFGGGIGEHASAVRRLILRDLNALGIVIDDNRNEAAAGKAAVISAPGSPIEARVQPVDEARMMALEALALGENDER